MVMVGDSFSKGPGFESQHCILDGDFFTYVPICCKHFNVCLKRRKMKTKKRPGLDHFFRKERLECGEAKSLERQYLNLR